MLSAEPKADADNTYKVPRPWLFWISQKPNLITVFLHIVLKKIMTNTPSQGTWILIYKIYCQWKSYIARTTYILVSCLLADNWLICRLRWFPNLALGSQPMRIKIMSTMYMYNNSNNQTTWLATHWFDHGTIPISDWRWSSDQPLFQALQLISSTVVTSLTIAPVVYT